MCFYLDYYNLLYYIRSVNITKYIIDYENNLQQIQNNERSPQNKKRL